ncbi:DUF896 domain-containing protein [Bacillus sp. FSL W7-1360]
MLSKKELARLNELSRLAKAGTLTEAQTKERQALRESYLATFRQSFKDHLHTVKVVDETGQDVTPQKLKDEQAKKYRTEG